MKAEAANPTLKKILIVQSWCNYQEYLLARKGGL